MTVPMLYVCAVSDFTLPIYEACLNIQPRELVLIISRNERVQDSAQRLIKLLKSDMPQCHLTILGKNGDGPDGDEPVSDLRWLQDKLLPLLDQRSAQGLQPVLNITGGTKSFALALQACFAWPRIDYLPHGKLLHAYRYIPAGANQASAFESLPTGFTIQSEGNTAGKPWIEIPPDKLAPLYNNDFRVESPNRIDSRTAAAQLARRIWEAQDNQDEALALLFAAMDHIWTSDDPPYQDNLIQLSWEEFFPPGSDSQQGYTQCLPWLRALSALDEVNGEDKRLAPILSFDAKHIKLPGNGAKKGQRDWKNWISGGWLEHAAHEFLLQVGIPGRAIIRGILAGANKSKSESMREADLLIHHRHRSTLVEIKAGLHSDRKLSDLEQQISSLNNFGKVEKGLLLGPALLQRLEKENRLESFQLRCGANKVTLLKDLDSLRNFVLGKKPGS